jgi:TRAP transporter TAXI family solute receptor
MRLIRVAAAMVAIAVAFGCSRGGGSRATFLSIATGGTGGVYYPYGGGIAKILNEKLPSVRATAEVTAASVDNLKLIRDGRTDIAFTMGDTLADAIAGRGPFDGRAVPARALAVLYSNYTQVVTLASSQIQSVADLAGHTVSTGSPNSGTELTSFRMLKAAGVDPDRGIRRQALGASESADALKDGKIDAFFWSGGLPTAAIQDLSHTPGITIRLVPSGNLLPQLRRDYGDVYFELQIPPGAYPGVSAPVPVVGVSNVLVVNASMTDGLAYDITRLIFENQPELAGIHPEAKNLAVATAVKGSPAAFHPGASRFYKQKGVMP